MRNQRAQAHQSDTPMVFSAHHGKRTDTYISVAAYTVVSLFIVSLLYRFDGDLGPNPNLRFVVAFYGFICFGALFPLILAFAVWRRLPRDIRTGRISISDTELAFDMDGQRMDLAWEDMHTLLPIKGSKSGPPIGLFVGTAPNAAPGSLAAWWLRRRWKWPFAVKDGIIVPLKVFLAEDTPRIAEAALGKFTATNAVP